MATPKIDPELLALIQLEARKAAEQVYTEKGTQYGVASVPAHLHNGVDTSKVPATSVEGFVPLPGTSGGVVDPSTLGNQVVTQGDTTRGYGHFSTVSQAVFPVYPLVIVDGNGVGGDSQFNGGDAPDGSMVFFDNGASISGLWVRSGGIWYGVGQNSTGYSNKIA